MLAKPTWSRMARAHIGFWVWGRSEVMSSELRPIDLARISFRGLGLVYYMRSARQTHISNQGDRISMIAIIDDSDQNCIGLQRYNRKYWEQWEQILSKYVLRSTGCAVVASLAKLNDTSIFFRYLLISKCHLLKFEPHSRPNLHRNGFYDISYRPNLDISQ